jgi:hypothetical protein
VSFPEDVYCGVEVIRGRTIGFTEDKVIAGSQCTLRLEKNGQRYEQISDMTGREPLHDMEHDLLPARVRVAT